MAVVIHREVKTLTAIFSFTKVVLDNPDLESLTINFCDGLTTVPTLPKLRHLKIAGCSNLISIAEQPCLESLCINACGKLLHLPPNAAQVTKLRVLASRQVTNLPHSYPNLTTLALSDLNGIELKELPKVIELSISHCWELKMLPPLPQVKNLDLGHVDNLLTLPKDLSALEVFRLQGCNLITALPPTLTRLHQLNLSFCNVKRLPSLPRLMRFLAMFCDELVAIPDNATQIWVNNCKLLPDFEK